MIRISLSFVDGSTAELESVPPSTDLTPKDEGLFADPTESRFAFARHDFELTEYGYVDSPRKYGVPRQRAGGFEGTNKNGIPETRMLYGRRLVGGEWRIYDFVEFSPAWQRRQYELLEWVLGGRLPRGSNPYYYVIQNGKEVKTTSGNPLSKVRYEPFEIGTNEKGGTEYYPLSMLGVWEECYRSSVALNDNHAYDNGMHDSILDRNRTAKDIQHKALHHGGNLLLTLGDDRRFGDFTKIEALDPSQPPPSLDYLLDQKKHCIIWGTAADVVQLSDGRWRVSRWGKLKAACRSLGIPYVGVPYFLYGYSGWQLIPRKFVIQKALGLYSPYVP